MLKIMGKKIIYNFRLKIVAYLQGSYASRKCQGNYNFFKVRELSGNFMLCQGKMNVF